MAFCCCFAVFFKQPFSCFLARAAVAHDFSRCCVLQERYQSSFGVKYDLELVKAALEHATHSETVSRAVVSVNACFVAFLHGGSSAILLSLVSPCFGSLLRPCFSSAACSSYASS